MLSYDDTDWSALYATAGIAPLTAAEIEAEIEADEAEDSRAYEVQEARDAACRAAEHERNTVVHRIHAALDAPDDPARLEAEHAEWLASGEPDILGNLLAKRKSDRTATLAELDAIQRTARRIRMAATSTDEQVEAAEAEEADATADWHRRYDYLWPPAELKLAAARWRQDKEKWNAGVAAMSNTLPANVPGPGGLPMMSGRSDKQAEIWAPILASVPHVDRAEHHPSMPDTGHPLRDAVNAAIPGIVASGNTDALAVIEAVHPDTAAKVGTITPAVKARAEALRQDAEHALAPIDYQRDHKGEIQRDNIDNMYFYLSSIGVEIQFNEWIERAEVRGWKWQDWTILSDAVVTKLRMRAGQTGTRFLPSKEFCWDALLALAYSNAVDPARDLLNMLEAQWDGTPRLRVWLTQACGVPCDAYHQAVGAVTLLGLVARIRVPGCKFDLMPVFVSERQGTSKSTLARLLALRDDWFIENVALGESAKELLLLLSGKAVAEISEMRSRGEIEAVNAMVSATHDEGRPAYGRTSVRRPRRHIFVGTTNRLEFLEDQTGGRRFLPILVQGEINLDWVRTNIDQLVGEAAAMQSRGVDINLPRDVWSIAAEHQDAATARTSAQVLLADWFAGDHPCWITSGNLVLLLRQALGRDVTRGNYAPAMRKLGFVSKTRRIGNDSPRAWVRGEPERDAPGVAATLGYDGRPQVRVQIAVDSQSVPTMPALPAPRRDA